MLACREVTQEFGGTAALSDVTLHVELGEIVGLIGPNGSGKSTLVNVLTGFYRPTLGQVTLDGHDVTGIAPHRLARAGVVRTFQNLRLFRELSVLENVLVGLHPSFLTASGSSRRWLLAALGFTTARRCERAARDTAYDALAALALNDYAHARVTDLSYGQQKRLELARAVVAKPKVLLLDEPTAGLSTAEADDVIKLIIDPIRQERLGLLLIEHRLDWVRHWSSRLVVLDAGTVIAAGSPDDVAHDAEVRRVYVGG